MGILVDLRYRVLRDLRRKQSGRWAAGKQVVANEPGSLLSAGGLLRGRRREKPLVVLARGVDESRLFRSLRNSELSWVAYTGCPVQPTVTDAEAIAHAWWDEGCDSFVVMGGGAIIDAVKAAAVHIAGRGRPIGKMAAGKALPRRKKPVVLAIPTAAGWGAESLTRAVLRDGNGRRMALAGRALQPEMVILDPNILEQTPRVEIAAAGMDGLCRAIEAYLVPGKGGEDIRAMAADAVRGFLENLEPCWNSGGTAAQRKTLLEASRLAAVAASSLGFGYARAMALAAEQIAGCEPGCAGAVLLPSVLEEYGDCVKGKLSELSEKCNIMTGGSRTHRAAAFIERLRAMSFRMGLSDTLDGVSREQGEHVAFVVARDEWCFAPVFWTEKQCRRVILPLCMENMDR